MSQIVVAVLAALVAAQYGVIGLYIVPRLARLAAEPALAVVRWAKWGAVSFFLGCATTHVGIAVHSLFEPALAPGHLLTVHLWPHLAQIIGGATFTYIVWRKLDLRFSPKGYEAERERIQNERDRAAALATQRAAEQQAVARLGQVALQTRDPQQIMDAAVRTIAKTLDAEFTKVLQLLPSGDGLRVIAGRGWRPGVVGELRLACARGSHAGYTLHSEEPVVVEDIRREQRFRIHPVFAGHGVTSGMAVAVGGAARPFGVLSVYTTARRRFSDHEVNFLKSVAHVLGTAIDRAAAEEEGRRRALHDALTGLPNRSLFVDRLNHALTRLARQPKEVAIVFLDLDDFKAVNDTFDHPVGDELLRAVAARLSTAVRSADTLARFGGDEFAVLCEDLDGADDAVGIAERVAEALAAPFSLAGSEHFVTASIGIAVAKDPHDRAVTLLRNADIAMYRAKERGRACIELYDDALHERSLARLRIENSLRGAVERGEMHLVYQPVVNARDGALRGVEALLRWEHPDWGPVSPGEFIPVAEDSGLIVPIGAWVLEEACRQAARWRAAHSHTSVKVSVNVSPHQLATPDFFEFVTGAMASAGLAPDGLAIEITETVLMQTDGAARASLHRLRDAGLHIVLDDFGTGYSSLSYLDRFPLDALKIDRSFVAGLADKPSSRAIFSAITTMASALELPVVAEGIETPAQVECILSLGCEFAQGYHFGRPMPPADIDRLLDRELLAAPPAAAA
jgi:diguanylate cyclase (GGDEF)-like protein